MQYSNIFSPSRIQHNYQNSYILQIKNWENFRSVKSKHITWHVPMILKWIWEYARSLVQWIRVKYTKEIYKIRIYKLFDPYLFRFWWFLVPKYSCSQNTRMAKKKLQGWLFCSLLSVDSENTKSLLLTEKKYGNALLAQFSPDYINVLN